MGLALAASTMRWFPVRNPPGRWRKGGGECATESRRETNNIKQHPLVSETWIKVLLGSLPACEIPPGLKSPHTFKHLLNLQVKS